jgi:tetratricopeptide (TPR) repeat protein
MRRAPAQLAIALGILLASMPALARQGSQKPDSSSKPSPGESSSRKDDSGNPSGAGGTSDSSGGGAPGYDPVSAQDDIDVGTFYMHKGDIDAAISRFEDAIRLRPTWAKPRMMLAEAFEKKKDKANAIKYYKEYLQVFPTAPDAKKVKERIDKLSSE